MKKKPFVGRREEMNLLKDALREAKAGHGGVFVLAGEPGIGKTRVAEELCRPARRLGMDVAWSACRGRRDALHRRRPAEAPAPQTDR